ncbi:hypothetical protein WMY93_006059 [Mugilogobius chulae]|uniref:Uncharacterized protein n=1 Tax=Mugilogobius chulae TaxID=88201 RepID=A0AAW0PUH0_9GOBI
MDAVQHKTSTAAQMLQNTRPNTQHPSTSRDAENGSTMMLNSKSAMAKFTMKKLVTVCKCLLHTTESITKMFPAIANRMKMQRNSPTPSACESRVKFAHVGEALLAFGACTSDPLSASIKYIPRYWLSFQEVAFDILTRHKEDLRSLSGEHCHELFESIHIPEHVVRQTQPKINRANSRRHPLRLSERCAELRDVLRHRSWSSFILHAAFFKDPHRSKGQIVTMFS